MNTDMNAEKTAAGIAYRQAILKRLVKHLLASEALPGHDESDPITIADVRRIFQHVLAEGYGQ